MRKNNIHIINGPNLNLLGKREPEIYGHQSFEDYLTVLQNNFDDVSISYFQSNIEGEIINEIQRTSDFAQGLVINSAGYTHTSVAIRDAITGISIPTIEVHISNIDAREDFRRTSMIGPVCIGSIAGLGLNGYRLAIQHLVQTNAKL